AETALDAALGRSRFRLVRNTGDRRGSFANSAAQRLLQIDIVIGQFRVVLPSVKAVRGRGNAINASFVRTRRHAGQFRLLLVAAHLYALNDRVGNFGGEQPNRAQRVIVAGN